MNQDQMNYSNQQDSQNELTWVCPKCHTLNQKNFCRNCGFDRNKPSTGMSGKGNPWKIACIVLALVVVVGAVALLAGGGGSDPAAEAQTESGGMKALLCFGNHKYRDATCTDPKICTECGTTEGEPLGHDYSLATCKSAPKCSRCGDISGKALSHKWADATYDSPQRCTLCGETTGNVKGYYAWLPCEWNSKRVSVGGTNTTPLVFDKTVKNCTQFTVYFQITDVDYGDPFGKFTAYAKIDGKWKKIGTFNANNKSEVHKTFKFDDPITFKQLAFVGPPRSSVSYSFSLWPQDWYLRD